MHTSDQPTVASTALESNRRCPLRPPAPQDVVALLRVPRSLLHITCASKGAVIGQLQLKESPLTPWLDLALIGQGDVLPAACLLPQRRHLGGLAPCAPQGLQGRPSLGTWAPFSSSRSAVPLGMCRLVPAGCEEPRCTAIMGLMYRLYWTKQVPVCC